MSSYDGASIRPMQGLACWLSEPKHRFVFAAPGLTRRVLVMGYRVNA